MIRFLCYFSKRKTGKFYNAVFSGFQGLNKQSSLDMGKVCLCSSHRISLARVVDLFLIHPGDILDQSLTLDRHSVDTAMISF